MAAAAGIGLGLIGASLAIGMLGYRYIAGQAWPDAFLNAAMILSGMGPVGDLKTTGAKIFAGIYALYSGLTLSRSSASSSPPSSTAFSTSFTWRRRRGPRESE
jgi:hypothetical protein